MRRWILCAGFIVTCWIAPAVATEYPWPPPKDEDLIKQADRIVLARCLNYEARNGRRGLDEDTTGPWTYMDFETIDLIKGTLPTQFSIRLFGGTDGAVQVSDSEPLPVFRPGEEAILLLGPDNQDGYPLVSLTTTWIYQAAQDPQSRLWVVTNPPAIKLLKAGTKDARAHDVSVPVTIEDVVWSIRQILQDSSLAPSDGTLPARH